MAKKYSGKTRRFGTVAVLLTVLTVVTVILLNGIVTKLALRYGWYIRMTPQLTFPVTELLTALVSAGLYLCYAYRAQRRA